MMFGGLPGGAPGPNAMMSRAGRIILTIMGIGLALFVYFMAKYIFEFAERERRKTENRESQDEQGPRKEYTIPVTIDRRDTTND